MLNIGIVGTGIFARDKHLPVLKELSDKFKATAAYNRTKSKAIDFANEAGIAEEKVYSRYEDLINDEDIDCIDMLVPAQYNAELVKMAVDVGKPMIFEKPIAAQLDQAREIVKITDNTSVPIAVAENWLFLKTADAVRSKLERIGEVAGFTYNSTGPFVTSSKYLSTGWRRNPEHIGGYLSDGGVHQLALLTGVLGEVDSVSALTRQLRQESGDDDIVFSTIKLKSGAIGTYTYGSAFGSTNKWVFMKIYGTNGSITVDLSKRGNVSLKLTVGDCAEAAAEEEEFTIEEDSSYGVKEEFENFYEAVTKKDKSIIKGTPRTTFHHLAVVSALLNSASQNGSSVEVEMP
ncbi:HEL203Cp [Eremothecium sinecaudum]|uniref:HEL203Cp n=1 Tax=Eremothecium sinecaudum TaxID=45286 RepID=A0A109UZN5_9SACH|nr:HEL203Cp [Eremothecium sinecaudum]AMD21078.1 HEL203Cp [Eremothecium sinecaudum]